MNRQIFQKALTDKMVSQRKMAKSLDMSPSVISDMLSGRLKGWRYRSRIARYLDLPEEELFPENGKQFSCQSTPVKSRQVT